MGENAAEETRTAAEKEAMVKDYEEKKANAKKEMEDYNSSSYKTADKQRSEMISSQTNQVASQGGDSNKTKNLLETNSPAIPTPPEVTFEEEKGYARGTRNVRTNKDKSSSESAGSTMNDTKSTKIDPKIKGDVGENSLVGNEMAILS